jgi:hypothetical protein
LYRYREGGGGGMPNVPPEILAKLMSDPSLMQAMQKPKVMVRRLCSC